MRPPKALESRSPEAVRALIARTEMLMPESKIRATRIFGPDGRYLEPATPESIVRAVARRAEPPDYGAIREQILAIYAIYSHIYNSGESQRPAHSFPEAQVNEIEGANHYVFISCGTLTRDRRDVLLEFATP